jgi:ATP-dependent Lhr-like helicase
VPIERVEQVLDRLTSDGSLVRGEFRPGGSGREYVDEGVLRQLRRRSLAALRAEVAPVDQVALARFLPAWQGVGIRRRGPDGLAEVIGVLQGAALPASVLETSILPARMAEYRPSDLDALCTSGEVVWVGAGAIGSRDGRIRLAFRDQIALLVSLPTDPPTNPEHDLIRNHLATSGASFWHEIVAAVAAGDHNADEPAVLEALWDLVWAGEVTNDSLAPLRSYVSKRKTSGSTQKRRRPRVGQIRATGPAQAAGRWSLVAPLLVPEPAPTQRLTARALQLVERYGVLTREAALGEGQVGGFAGVYPLLKALEERGELRRGYFVEGLGAAQFALPGAVDRLRSAASDRNRQDDGTSTVHVLASTDPAQPYGASLPWPDTEGRPARTAGSHVVLVDGEAAIYLERGAKSMLTFEAALNSDRWIEPLVDLVRSKTIRTLEIAKINGVPWAESETTETLVAHGFVKAYKGLTWVANTRSLGS